MVLAALMGALVVAIYGSVGVNLQGLGVKTGFVSPIFAAPRAGSTGSASLRTPTRPDWTPLRERMKNRPFLPKRPREADLKATCATRVPNVGVRATVETTTQPEDVLIKSPNDAREYKSFQMDNGLDVLLISDEDADSAAAAMGIQCGSWCDPEDIPGMAHFLEHMMFLGTEKYPEENDYSAFLNQHGGYSNAFTSSETTVFYFSVDSDFLEPSLDRFAQFFIKPLFNPDATEREINAIDSEHKQYIQSDFRRLYEVYKSQANPQHPFSRFATGDKSTLARPDIRDRLVDFHSKRYSSNLMGLTVYGKESIAELEKWTKDIFKNVPNKRLQKPEFSVAGSVLEESARKKQLSVLPIADEHSLLLSWPVDLELRDVYRENPHGFLSYVLSSEAPNGLISELKNREWIAGLNGRPFIQSKGLNVYTVSVDLTDKGVSHIDEIIDMVYQYLGQIKRNGLDSEQWQELINLAEVDFRFAEKGDPGNLASHLASKMLDKNPLADLLSPPSRQMWRPDLISELIDQMTPDKMMLLVSSKKPFASEAEKEETEQTERWYGTRYRKRDLKPKQVELWDASLRGKRKSSTELKLPPTNPYIPSDFTLVEEPLPAQLRQKKQKDESGLWRVSPPTLVFNNSDITLWHSSEGVKEFPVPRVQALSVMRTPLAHSNPKNQVLTEMYLDLVGDYLMEALYLPSVAGYSFSMGSSDSGFTCALQGYSQNVENVLEEALNIVSQSPFSETRFESIKEETLRGYENFFQGQPYEQASHYMALATNQGLFGIPELKEALQTTSLQQVKEFVPELLSSQWSLETLVHGNMREEEAKRLAAKFRQILQGGNSNATVSTPMQQKYQLDLGMGNSFVIPIQLTNPEEVNSATVVKIQLGSRGELSTKELSIASLIGSMIQEPAFDDLRTKQQLGYIVSAGVGVSRNVFTLSALVQGAQHSAEYYDSQIDAFLRKFEKELAQMSDTEIDAFKSSLESALLRKDLTLMERGVRYWDPIGKQLYNFSWNIDRIKALREVTRDDILKFYKEKVTNPASRRRVSVRMESQAEKNRQVQLVNPAVPAKIVDDVASLAKTLAPFEA